VSRISANCWPSSAPPNGSSFERSTPTSKKRFAKPVRQLGRRQVPKQLISGDVPNDRDVRGGSAQRVVAHDRLQWLAIPRLADDRR